MFISCSVSMQVISCQSSRSRCRLLNCLTYKYFTGWCCADFLVKERSASSLVLVCNEGESCLCVEDKTSLFSFVFSVSVLQKTIFWLVSFLCVKDLFYLVGFFEQHPNWSTKKSFVDFEKTKVELETADQLWDNESRAVKSRYTKRYKKLKKIKNKNECA